MQQIEQLPNELRNNSIIGAAIISHRPQASVPDINQLLCFHSSIGLQFLRSSNFEINFNFNLFVTEPQVFPLLKCVNYLTSVAVARVVHLFFLRAAVTVVKCHSPSVQTLSFVPIIQPIPVPQNYSRYFDVCTVNLVQFIIQTNKCATYVHIYTGCPRRNVPNFGRVFLMLNYTDITQNTYIQS